MSRAGINPVTFARNRLNEFVNSHGPFTYSAEVAHPLQILNRFREHPDLDLIQQLDVPEIEIDRVWQHKDSDSLLMLREVPYEHQAGCDECSSKVNISSATHEGLAWAIQIYEGIGEESLNHLMAQFSGEDE